MLVKVKKPLANKKYAGVFFPQNNQIIYYKNIKAPVYILQENENFAPVFQDYLYVVGNICKCVSCDNYIIPKTQFGALLFLKDNICQGACSIECVQAAIKNCIFCHHKDGTEEYISKYKGENHEI